MHVGVESGGTLGHECSHEYQAHQQGAERNERVEPQMMCGGCARLIGRRAAQAMLANLGAASVPRPARPDETLSVRLVV